MRINNRILIFTVATIAAACQPASDLEKKRSELKEKKAELNQLRTEIASLEDEISSMDQQFARENRRATLVSVFPVNKEDFTSYVEISGTVNSRRNVSVSAETVGVIEEIPVKDGQSVRQGQLLIKLENETLQRSLDELKTNYDLANTMYEKQSNLWKKNIGTEVQYLEAKNRKESLENQIKTVQTQIKKTYIKAPFSGIIDQLDAKIGMLAQPGVSLIQLVSSKDMYITAEISEAYIGAFQRGDKANVTFPSMNRNLDTEISAVGQVINPDNRTFDIEVAIPQVSYEIKPNLISVVRIKDFEASDVPVIPTNLIQKDSRGEFVYIVDNNNGTTIAKKVHITRGKTYHNKTMIEEGLQGGEKLINEGFRDVSDGVNIKIVENTI